MTPDTAFFISSLFWGFVIGILIGYDKPSKIFISIKPTKAPPPEAFKKQ
tara:strand:- start:25 stop:171 length:147 start_codon:yes stop_codon:yes gene_type:complete